MALELFQQYENFFGIIIPVCGLSSQWLYGRVLLQEHSLCTLHLSGLLQPDPCPFSTEQNITSEKLLLGDTDDSLYIQ